VGLRVAVRELVGVGVIVGLPDPVTELVGISVGVAELVGVTVAVADNICEPVGVNVGVIVGLAVALAELDPVTFADCVKGVVIDPKGEALILAVEEPDSLGKGLNEYKAVKLFAETLLKILGLSLTLPLIPRELLGPRLIDTKGEAVKILGVGPCEEDDVVVSVIEFVANTESVFRKEELRLILAVEPDSVAKGEGLTETLPKTLWLSLTLALRPRELVAATLIETNGEGLAILGVGTCEEDDVVLGVIEFVGSTESVFRKEELTLILAVEPDSVAKGEGLAEKLPKTLGLSVRLALRPGELVSPTLIDTKGEAVKILGVGC